MRFAPVSRSAPLPCELGRYYDVPHVHASWYDRTQDWPVLGPAHDDREVIDFPYWHYHIDYRFVSAEVLIWLRQFTVGSESAEFFFRRSPLMLLAKSRAQFTRTNAPKPTVKRAMCKRQWSSIDVIKQAGRSVEKSWFPALENAYAGKRLIHGHCPHRNVDLRSLPADADGCVECPLHGLRWHRESGELAPRFAPQGKTPCA